MKRRLPAPWSIAFVSLVVACASGGGGGTSAGEKTAHAKRAPGCDNFANPCSAEEACIDGSCRPKACSTDGDCGGNSGCFQGWCLARQCRENNACLGDD